MCARFTLATIDVEALARELAAEVERARLDPALERPRYNVAPSQAALVLRVDGGRRLLGPARFGLTGREGRPYVNVRAESLARGAGRRARCVVPVDGFYEWEGARGGRRPYWLTPPGGGPLLLAGLWQPGRPDVGGPGPLAERAGDAAEAPGFAIVTTPANAVVAALHDRMPALLTRDEVDAWLADGDVRLLRPASDAALVARPVSPLVNSPKNDGPELLAAPEPDRQLGLF